MGYVLANPLRRLYQNPEKILSPYIKEGFTILEAGPGMGFFTIPMAGLAGQEGKVYAVDLQQKMLSALDRRAEKAGLSSIIKTRTCSSSSLNIQDLNNTVDFVLLFAVVHEVRDQEKLFEEVFEALKEGGTLLISEPAAHLSEKDFAASLNHAKMKGFKAAERPVIRGGRSALLVK